jgi:hypothetical protein
MTPINMDGNQDCWGIKLVLCKGNRQNWSYCQEKEFGIGALPTLCAKVPMKIGVKSTNISMITAHNREESMND